MMEIPKGDFWIKHLQKDIMPFWLMPSAIGNPPGFFPTYRNNNGSPVSFENPTPEFQNPDPNLVVPGRWYVRMASRQIFGYGVAFHLTGERLYLELALKGWERLLEYGWDKESGCFFSYREREEEKKVDMAQQTSQDLAYALCGPAMLFYLTRDDRILKIIDTVKNKIFEHYFDRSNRLMSWHPVYTQNATIKLVAHLDPIYAYLLLITGCLTGSYKENYLQEMHALAESLITHFLWSEQGVFWGGIHCQTGEKLSENTDFGHTVKAWWLLERLGTLFAIPKFSNLAQQILPKVLRKAQSEDVEGWASGFQIDSRGHWKMARDREWWSFAILNQATGTMGLCDSAYRSLLLPKYDYWLKYMVDHQHKEVWHMVSHRDNRPLPQFPKQHAWKNALHTCEHALVNHIVCRAFTRENVTLFFHLKNPQLPQPRFNPYLFRGHIVKVRIKKNSGTSYMQGETTAVEFNNIA